MKRKTPFAVLVSLVIASLILAACATLTSEPIEVVVTKEVEVTTVVEKEAVKEVEKDLVGAGDCYVPNHVLITGRQSDVEYVADALGNLTLLTEIRFDYLETLLARMSEQQQVGSKTLLRHFPPEEYEYRELTTNLYRIEDGTSVIDVIYQVYAQPVGGLVFADPNYLIGHPDIVTRGSHWAALGSPNEGLAAPASEDDFGDQWAFEHVNLSSAGEFTGEDVLVGVFDTFARPDFDFVSPYVEVEYGATAENISDHGPFVVRLVEGVAPGSKIIRYRVLDDYGVGTLDALIQALKEFGATLSGTSEFKGSVINLSLGLHCANEVSFDGLTGPQLGIQALQERLLSFYRGNTVIVAASGNASQDVPDIPAYWSDIVIGVAASNKDREQACFSNRGYLLAPGGEGDQANCLPALDQCAGQGPDCEFGLISRAPSVPETGYAYWAGTSFAAPLVSGLAALTYEAFDPGTTGSRASNEVKGAIECGAHLYSDGVINVGATLQEMDGVEGTPPIQCALWDTMVFSGGPFDDPRVSRAVLHTIDWLAVAEYLSDSPLPAYLWEWDWDTNRPRTRKLSDQDVLQVAYDKETAQQLLDEAGWIDTDGDGFRDRDGTPLFFSIWVWNYEPHVKAAELIHEWAKDIGVDSEIVFFDPSTPVIWQITDATQDDTTATLFLLP